MGYTMSKLKAEQVAPGSSASMDMVPQVRRAKGS